MEKNSKLNKAKNRAKFQKNKAGKDRTVASEFYHKDIPSLSINTDYNKDESGAQRKIYNDKLYSIIEEYFKELNPEDIDDTITHIVDKLDQFDPKLIDQKSKEANEIFMNSDFEKEMEYLTYFQYY